MSEGSSRGKGHRARVIMRDSSLMCLLWSHIPRCPCQRRASWLRQPLPTILPV